MEANKKLTRALRLARILIAADDSLRYSEAQKIELENRFFEAVRDVAIFSRMNQDNANDQIVIRAYCLPLLQVRKGSC